MQNTFRYFYHVVIDIFDFSFQKYHLQNEPSLCFVNQIISKIFYFKMKNCKYEKWSNLPNRLTFSFTFSSMAGWSNQALKKITISGDPLKEMKIRTWLILPFISYALFNYQKSLRQVYLWEKIRTKCTWWYNIFHWITNTCFFQIGNVLFQSFKVTNWITDILGEPNKFFSRVS